MACPICARPTANANRPFCSRRCADVDLGRWVTGAYTLPGDAPADCRDHDPPDPSDDKDRG